MTGGKCEKQPRYPTEELSTPSFGLNRIARREWDRDEPGAAMKRQNLSDGRMVRKAAERRKRSKCHR